MPGQQAVHDRPRVGRGAQDRGVPENGHLKLAVRFQAGHNFGDRLRPRLLVHGGHAHPDAREGGAGLAQHARFLIWNGEGDGEREKTGESERG